MSEIPEPQEVTSVEERKKEEPKARLHTRVGRKIRQVFRAYFWYCMVAATFFVIGRYYPIIQSVTRILLYKASNEFISHSGDPFTLPRGNSESRCASPCNLYPEEPVCKAAKNPGGESINTDSCFGVRGSEFDPSDLVGLPAECSKFGPLELIDLDDLWAKKTRFRAITEVPPSIKPFFGAQGKGVSMKSALVTYLIILKAHGDVGENLFKDPVMGPMMRDLSLTSDDGLTEDERKVVGQMISLYNGFAAVSEELLIEQRLAIKKDCARFSDMDLVPIRCLVVDPQSCPNSPRPFGPDPFGDPNPPPSATPL